MRSNSYELVVMVEVVFPQILHRLVWSIITGSVKVITNVISHYWRQRNLQTLFCVQRPAAHWMLLEMPPLRLRSCTRFSAPHPYRHVVVIVVTSYVHLRMMITTTFWQLITQHTNYNLLLQNGEGGGQIGCEFASSAYTKTGKGVVWLILTIVFLSSRLSD